VSEPEPTPASSATATATTAPAAARGVRAVDSDEFHLAEALGGTRGVIETALPGILFVAVWTVTSNLYWSLGSASAVAVLAVLVRLIQRQTLTQALSGVFGIGLGVLLAWQARDGGADDAQAAVRFFLPGLFINAAYLVGVLFSIIIRWPFVGVIVELLRLGFTEQKAEKARKEAIAEAESSGETGDAEAIPAEVEPESVNPFRGWTAWRRDPELMRRYNLASWVWVAAYVIRLAVQVPMYLANQPGALGVSRLILGTPLWGLVLWLTWVIVRGARKGKASDAADAADANSETPEAAQ